MMALDLKLLRSNDEESWGFRLIGGTDLEMPLTVIKVQPSTPAEAAGLQNGDALTLINGVPSAKLSHDGAYEVIKTAGLELELKIVRGRYEAVLDDQEPIFEEIEYDQQLDYFDPQLEDPSEVFRPIGYPAPVPETPTIQVPVNESISRSLTASPFVLPTKPYRPFSTEPIELPPLEEPIILNPEFHDEFGSFDQDLLPKTRFKLPVSEQYDPDFGKEKKTKTKVVETVKETCLSECYQNDSRIEEFMIKVKEETVLNKRADDFQQISYSEKYKDEMVQCDVGVVEETASRVVRESIERALSVAEEVKQEMCSENVCSSNETTNSQQISSLSEEHKVCAAENVCTSYESINSKQILDLLEENKVCVAEKIKEFESVVHKSEAKHEARDARVDMTINQKEELSSIDVNKIVSVFNDSAKTASEDLQTCKQKSLVTRAESKIIDNKTSESQIVDNKASEVKTNVKYKTQSETANKENVDTKQTSNMSSSTYSQVKTLQDKSSSSTKSAEQRAFVIGLQTIPKIRGNVHSSYRYNLLLKTFFLHLTDVMVALSRFILTEPAYAITDDQVNAQNVAKDRKQSIEEQLQVIQQISETITNAEIESSENIIKEHNVKVSDVVKNERERDLTNDVISSNLFDKLSVEANRIKKLSGSKMAQLVESKPENEFQNKTYIDEKFEDSQEKSEEVIIKNQISEKTDFVMETKTVDMTSVAEFSNNFIDKQEKTVTESELVAVTNKVPKEDKHYYVATVESHVYTNKDTILSEQLSDTSSLQSVEATCVVETCEQTSSIKENVTSSQAFLDNSVESCVVTDICNEVIEAQKIDGHERTDIDILETKIANDLYVVEEPVEATKLEPKKEASIDLKYESSEIQQQFNIKQASSKIKEEYTTSTEQVASFVAKQSKNYTEETKIETQTNVESNSEVFSEAFLGKAGLTSDLNYTKIETKSEEMTATKNIEQSFTQTSKVETSTITSAMAQKRAELQRLTFKDDPKISRSSSGSSFPSTIGTPTPATVPPTPLTDEYMFRLQHQLPKEFPYIVNDSEFSPERSPVDHEDLDIVKKKLIPHIDTAIEQVKYDMPLPSPPAFYKRGSLSGSPQGDSRRSSKEDIKEIERRSSLLASAIDQTIKNIEQYREQVGIETKRSSLDNSVPDNDNKSPVRKQSIEINPKRVSISETPQVINLETVAKPEIAEKSQMMYECVVDEAKTTVFTDTKEKIEMAHEWAKVIGELKVNGKSSDNTTSDEAEVQSKPVELMQPDVTLIETINKVSDVTQTAGNEKSFQSQSEFNRFQTQNTTQTEISKSFQSSESTRTSGIPQSCQLRRDSVPGFRPVIFNPSVATYTTQSTNETMATETSQVEKTSKKEVVEKSSKVEESARQTEVVESVEVTEPVPGYRPVKFDPEEISKYLQNEEMIRQQSGFRSVQINVSNVEGSMTSEQKLSKRYMTPDGEILGTQQGIVDGLEEPVIPPDVAKELGKPGMTEDKIAELISGESEMLREAHVMGLSRVIGSHMTRVDENDSSVDFKKIKPTIERLKDSEVIKALNEEVVKEKVEKKVEGPPMKWTTFLQKPTRPVPKAKFGYHGWTSVEVLPQDQYKVKIVKQPKPKIAPDYNPKDFNTGLLPWEERAANEPPPPPVVAEDPILIPEDEVEFYEAVDPMPESAVPDLEETGIPLPEQDELTDEKQEVLSEIADVPEDQDQEAQQFDIDQAIADTEKIVIEDMEKNQLSDQLMLNVQSMVDPNATLEQQLAQMRLQLSALAQLPSVIQQTLELVTKQLSQITQQDASKVDSTVGNVETASTPEKPTHEPQEQIVQENDPEDSQVETVEEPVTDNDVDALTAMNTEQNEMIQEVKVSSSQEEKKTVCMKTEQKTIEMQKQDVIDQMQLQIESRQVKNYPTPRSANPKPAFGPLTPQERPLVLPGGRRWKGPKDVYNEQYFTETLAAQAELIQGKTMGINFMKYEKPPVSLDHLKDSDVYKMVHNMDNGPMRRVDYLNKSIAESDYREHCRSMTPCPTRMPREEQHTAIPQQLQP